VGEKEFPRESLPSLGFLFVRAFVEIPKTFRNDGSNPHCEKNAAGNRIPDAGRNDASVFSLPFRMAASTAQRQSNTCKMFVK